MTKAEARRRICHGAAVLLDNGSHNAWLHEDQDGNDFSAADQKRLREAFDALVKELRKRGSGVRVERAHVVGPSIKRELERLRTFQASLGADLARRTK